MSKLAPVDADGLLEPAITDRERVYFDNLLAPVNPSYDFDADPADQFEYANPVTLNNKLVLFTNAMIELNKRAVSLARRRERKRLEKKDLDRQLKSLRNAVLSLHPIPPSSAKNLPLTEAYIVRCLEAEGLLDQYKQLELTAGRLDDEIDFLKEEGENLRFTFQTIQLASNNITMHLSYVKQEARMGARTHGAA
jgi:hypothetical protein